MSFGIRQQCWVRELRSLTYPSCWRKPETRMLTLTSKRKMDGTRVRLAYARYQLFVSRLGEEPYHGTSDPSGMYSITERFS